MSALYTVVVIFLVVVTDAGMYVTVFVLAVATEVEV